MFASLTSAALAVTHIALNLTAASPTLFDGCVEVGPGPTCFVAADTTLVIWTSESETTQPLFNGRALVSTSMESVDGGTQFELPLPATHGTVTLKDDSNATSFHVDIVPVPHDPAVQAAHEALSELPAQKALNVINTLMRDAQPAQQAEILRTKARLHTRLDENNIAQAVFRAAINSARKHGQHYTAIKSATALAFSLRQHQRDTLAAREAMESVADLVSLHGASHFLWSYHRGMVAFTADNARTQLQYFEKAARIAHRTGQSVRHLRADTILAVVQQSLGQRDAAGARLQRWADQLPDDLPGCERAIFWTNLAWNALLQLEAQETPDNPVPVLQKALFLSDAHCATTERINARLNLALAHWHQDNLDDAQNLLDDARELTSAPATHLAYWATDIEGRIMTSRGDFDGALAQFETLAERATAAAQPATRWRARVRQAWAMQLAGRSEEAVRLHRTAEIALDEQVLRTPLQAGRESLLAARRFAMRDHLYLLLQQQRFDAALALIRRESSRAIEQIHVAARIGNLTTSGRAQWETYRRRYENLRASASSEQANSWQLSRAALEAFQKRGIERERELEKLLDDGVSALLPQSIKEDLGEPLRYSRREPLLGIWQSSHGWAVLLDRGDEVVGVTPDCPTLNSASARIELAGCLLRSIAPHLDGAHAVSLLADDTLADVDWHALSIGDEQWIDRLAIRYVSGLPTTTRATPGPGLALLVSDPDGNLGAARNEVSEVRKRLRGRSTWSDDTLLGNHAQMSAVRSRLTDAALFHYAGHASFGENSGWNSALLLANNTRLGIGDILTLEAAPQLVVLSGCETARRAGITTPAIGLAHAFLARGSSAVIATTRSVDDLSARTVVQHFYDHWLDGQSVHESLRAAQRQTRDQQPGLDWSAFRIIEP